MTGGFVVLENLLVKVTYDRETDTPVAESDENKPGVILDHDASGNLVSLEIPDAAQRIMLPTRIEYQVAPAPP